MQVGQYIMAIKWWCVYNINYKVITSGNISGVPTLESWMKNEDEAAILLDSSKWPPSRTKTRHQLACGQPTQFHLKMANKARACVCV